MTKPKYDNEVLYEIAKMGKTIRICRVLLAYTLRNKMSKLGEKIKRVLEAAEELENFLVYGEETKGDE